MQNWRKRRNKNQQYDFSSKLATHFHIINHNSVIILDRLWLDDDESSFSADKNLLFVIPPSFGFEMLDRKAALALSLSLEHLIWEFTILLLRLASRFKILKSFQYEINVYELLCLYLCIMTGALK